MPPVDALPILLVEPIVRSALLEDLGRAGDITSMALLPADARCVAAIVAREPGTIAGTEAAALAFQLLDPAARVVIERPDGAVVEPGDSVMRVDGPARAVLAAERVALNLLCHLSGIATATAELVGAIRPHPARITCTRKTTPNLRALDKHAVRVGGGVNHRFGLDDGVPDQGQPHRDFGWRRARRSPALGEPSVTWSRSSAKSRTWRSYAKR